MTPLASVGWVVAQLIPTIPLKGNQRENIPKAVA